ncbi:ABC transporter permease [Oleiharenicola lentus]|uniref:ABC transporter permease n=1 Tax=Oleiharenicola lentus TaxID=2508720 RepID=A0A4Q1CC29_9BACT|nr:ABC transporter permease [Oleiharenicola lentus]RXK56501.1 ABC transporter permease [Oleiharenicola lentus]
MKLPRKFLNLFRRRELDAEMAEEMRLHVELQTERNRAAGMSPEEARYAALRLFGNVASVQEQAREGRGWVWLEQGWREWGFAFRALSRARGFSLAVIGTLVLCIGPNTAILSVLYSLVLKPLPFRDEGQLVRITNVAEKSGGAKYQSTLAQYRDFRANADRFESFALWSGQNHTIGDGSTPERVWGAQVTADFFGLLQVKPLLGRFFSSKEQVPGQDRVLVLTQSFWESRYHKDPTILGREILVADQPFVVIGVAPRQVEALDAQVRFLRPFVETPARADPLSRYEAEAIVLGRLRKGVTVEEGRAQLQVLEQRFYEGSADARLRRWHDEGGYRIGVGRVRDEETAGLRSRLLMIQGGALLVLLIGCVNVVNLWLARVSAKRMEFAVRYSLGAGRVALLRQILWESLLLTSAATVAGVGLAWGGLQIFNQYLAAIQKTIHPVTLELGVLGCVLAGVATVAVIVGVLPWALLSRSDLSVTASRTASAGRVVRRLGGALVIAQVAISIVLLVGAGLLLRSFAHVLAVKPGFDASRIVQGRVAFPKGYEDATINVATQQRVLAAMKEIPGVESAASVSDFGVMPDFGTLSVVVRGADPVAGGRQATGQFVSPEFFATMGIPILEGRAFTGTDFLRDGTAVIVDEAFAERYFPGRSAVGQEISFDAGGPPEGAPWLRIVGVVGRAQLTGLEQRDGLPFAYGPFSGAPAPAITLLLRTSRPLSDVLAEMREKLRAIDARFPLYETTTLQDVLDGLLTPRRGLVLLLGMFAGLALTLAGVGLYGVLAYDVAQRTKEIGIRSAIGATRGQIAGLILRQGVGKSCAGIGLGLMGAFYFTRFLESFLFDVKPTDPLVFLGVSALLLGVAAAASWLPARRAAKVDPVVALRAE